jgi:hypothetical protein
MAIPEIQGISDKALAENTATETNNWAADQVKDGRAHIGAFSCLSMHDPKQADQELRRCVQELGFNGAHLCSFQYSRSMARLPLLRLARLQRVLERPHRARCQLVHQILYIYPAAHLDVFLDEL